jgi:hypothetical protein
VVDSRRHLVYTHFYGIKSEKTKGPMHREGRIVWPLHPGPRQGVVDGRRDFRLALASRAADADQPRATNALISASARGVREGGIGPLVRLGKKSPLPTGSTSLSRRTRRERKSMRAQACRSDVWVRALVAERSRRTACITSSLQRAPAPSSRCQEFC